MERVYFHSGTSKVDLCVNMSVFVETLLGIICDSACTRLLKIGKMLRMLTKKLF